MESIHQSWQRILDPNLDPRLFRNAFLLAKIKAMSKAIEEEKINKSKDTSNTNRNGLEL